MTIADILTAARSSPEAVAALCRELTDAELEGEIERIGMHPVTWVRESADYKRTGRPPRPRCPRNRA